MPFLIPHLHPFPSGSALPCLAIQIATPSSFRSRLLVILSAAKNLATIAIHARFFAALRSDGLSAASDGSIVTAKVLGNFLDFPVPEV